MNRPNKENRTVSYQRGRGRRAERVKRIDGTVRGRIEILGGEPAAG